MLKQPYVGGSLLQVIIGFFQRETSSSCCQGSLIPYWLTECQRVCQPAIARTQLGLTFPKVYFNFKQHQISPGAYLPDWLIPLFLDHLPFEACARIWDVLLLEGDSFLYRASLGILAVLEPRLFFPEKKELLELLKYEFCIRVLVPKLTIWIEEKTRLQ